jgi:hypothetical protein
MKAWSADKAEILSFDPTTDALWRFGEASDDVVMDGSCEPHRIKDLARASWAVGELGPGEEEFGIVVHGPVWRPLPQTAPASEHCAAAALAQLLTASVTAHSDCMAVVNEARKPEVQQLRKASIYAGIRRYALESPGAHHIDTIDHVKAHRTDKDILALPAGPRRLATGNRWIDIRAKKAIECHDAPAQAKITAVDQALRCLDYAAAVIAATLPIYPRPERLVTSKTFQQQLRARRKEDAKNATVEASTSITLTLSQRLEHPGPLTKDTMLVIAARTSDIHVDAPDPDVVGFTPVPPRAPRPPPGSQA